MTVQKNPSMTTRNTADSTEASLCWHLTPESFAALAVEHLCLLDLACSAVIARIWLAGVVATFANAAAVQTVTLTLLQVEHPVVDIQQANAAHQTCGHRGPFPHTEQWGKNVMSSFNMFDTACT